MLIGTQNIIFASINTAVNYISNTLQSKEEKHHEKKQVEIIKLITTNKQENFKAKKPIHQLKLKHFELVHDKFANSLLIPLFEIKSSGGNEINPRFEKTITSNKPDWNNNFLGRNFDGFTSSITFKDSQNPTDVGFMKDGKMLIFKRPDFGKLYLYLLATLSNEKVFEKNKKTIKIDGLEVSQIYFVINKNADPVILTTETTSYNEKYNLKMNNIPHTEEKALSFTVFFNDKSGSFQLETNFETELYIPIETNTTDKIINKYIVEMKFDKIKKEEDQIKMKRGESIFGTYKSTWNKKKEKKFFEENLLEYNPLPLPVQSNIIDFEQDLFKIPLNKCANKTKPEENEKFFCEHAVDETSDIERNVQSFKNNILIANSFQENSSPLLDNNVYKCYERDKNPQWTEILDMDTYAFYKSIFEEDDIYVNGLEKFPKRSESSNNAQDTTETCNPPLAENIIIDVEEYVRRSINIEKNEACVLRDENTDDEIVSQFLYDDKSLYSNNVNECVAPTAVGCNLKEALNNTGTNKYCRFGSEGDHGVLQGSLLYNNELHQILDDRFVRNEKDKSLGEENDNFEKSVENKNNKIYDNYIINKNENEIFDAVQDSRDYKSNIITDKQTIIKKEPGFIKQETELKHRNLPPKHKIPEMIKRKSEVIIKTPTAFDTFSKLDKSFSNNLAAPQNTIVAAPTIFEKHPELKKKPPAVMKKPLFKKETLLDNNDRLTIDIKKSSTYKYKPSIIINKHPIVLNKLTDPMNKQTVVVERPPIDVEKHSTGMCIHSDSTYNQTVNQDQVFVDTYHHPSEKKGQPIGMKNSSSAYNNSTVVVNKHPAVALRSPIVINDSLVALNKEKKEMNNPTHGNKKSGVSIAQKHSFLHNHPDFETRLSRCLNKKPDVINTHSDFNCDDPDVINVNPVIINKTCEFVNESREVVIKKPEILSKKPVIKSEKPEFVSKKPFIRKQNSEDECKSSTAKYKNANSLNRSSQGIKKNSDLMKSLTILINRQSGSLCKESGVEDKKQSS